MRVMLGDGTVPGRRAFSVGATVPQRIWAVTRFSLLPGANEMRTYTITEALAEAATTERMRLSLRQERASEQPDGDFIRDVNQTASRQGTGLPLSGKRHHQGVTIRSLVG
jgi:hypothetical protein